MTCVHLPCFAPATLAMFLLVAPLVAQPPQPVGDQPLGDQRPAGSLATNKVTEFEGKLIGTQGNVLMVAREDETEVLVQMPDDVTSLTFVAEAEREFLRRGMMVRFEAEFAPNGAPTAPVENLEVFQPIQLKQLPRTVRERFVPGVYPKNPQQQQQQLQQQQQQQLQQQQLQQQQQQQQQQQAPQAEPASYRVVGNLMGIDESGMVLVKAGPRTLRIPLAPEPEIELRFNNLNLVQPEDEVSVAGFYRPPDETKVKADKITITTDRVYGEQEAEEPQRGSRANARRNAAKGGDGAEARRLNRGRRGTPEGEPAPESPRK